MQSLDGRISRAAPRVEQHQQGPHAQSADNSEEDSNLNVAPWEHEAYKAIRHLASGSQGHVYLCRITREASTSSSFGNPLVVVKSEPILANGSSKGLRDEVELLKSLSHANVVRMLDDSQGSGEHGLHRMLILEYANKGSLRDLLNKNSKLQNRAAGKYFFQLSSALSYLNVKMRVIHRDVKPDNILLHLDSSYQSVAGLNKDREDLFYTVKLADFGISIRTVEDRPNTACIGTPAYLAPEVASGQEYDWRIDIWAAGAVLFEMLSGQFYSKIQPNKTLLSKILIESISRNGAIFLQDLLAEDPSKRPSWTEIKEASWVKTRLIQALSEMENCMTALGDLRNRRQTQADYRKRLRLSVLHERSEDEERISVTCSQCGQVGHNMNGCRQFITAGLFKKRKTSGRY